MRLVFAALCVAAVAFPGLAQARLVGHEEAGFAECDGFFYGGAAPDGLLREAAPGKKLCQKYNGEPRFATLYSTHDKIPVYSAFKYAAAAAAPGEEEQVGVQERWQVEPQVSWGEGRKAARGGGRFRERDLWPAQDGRAGGRLASVGYARCHSAKRSTGPVG